MFRYSRWWGKPIPSEKLLAIRNEINSSQIGNISKIRLMLENPTQAKLACIIYELQKAYLEVITSPSFFNSLEEIKKDKLKKWLKNSRNFDENTIEIDIFDHSIAYFLHKDLKTNTFMLENPLLEEAMLVQEINKVLEIISNLEFEGCNPLLCGPSAAVPHEQKFNKIIENSELLGIETYLDILKKKRDRFNFWIYIFVFVPLWGLMLWQRDNILAAIGMTWLRAVIAFLAFLTLAPVLLVPRLFKSVTSKVDDINELKRYLINAASDYILKNRSIEGRAFADSQEYVAFFQENPSARPMTLYEVVHQCIVNNQHDFLSDFQFSELEPALIEFLENNATKINSTASFPTDEFLSMRIWRTPLLSVVGWNEEANKDQGDYSRKQKAIERLETIINYSVFFNSNTHDVENKSSIQAFNSPLTETSSLYNRRRAPAASQGEAQPRASSPR